MPFALAPEPVPNLPSAGEGGEILAGRSAWAERHTIQLRLLAVGEPGKVTGQHDIIDECVCTGRVANS
jgi:hypothetical protein